jgi:DDE superfamily endonuclease
VIADNASYHRGKTLQRFVEESDGDIVVEHLPRYAPEFNPDEQVWNHAKARLAKRFIATKDDLLQEMRKIMRSIQQSPALARAVVPITPANCGTLTLNKPSCPLIGVNGSAL